MNFRGHFFYLSETAKGFNAHVCMDATEWRTVLSFGKVLPMAPSYRAVIVGISDHCGVAFVRSLESGAVMEIDYPFHERSVSLCEVIRASNCFRIEVDICDDMATRHHLTVQRDAFLGDIHYGIKGEYHIVSLMLSVYQTCSLPRSMYKDDHEPNFADSGDRVEDDSFVMPLRPHQSESLKWLRYREANPYVSYRYCIVISDTEWCLDIRNECFRPTKACSSMHMTFKGGLLVDGIAMGKTATMIALISSSSDVIHTRRMSHVSTSYIARASLVIVPISLPMQWISEIRKCTGESLRVVRLINGKDMKNIDMHTLMMADVVITTFAFLRASKPYLELIDKVCNPNRSIDEERRKAGRNKAAIMCWSRHAHQTDPVLEGIHWPRIILDEVHETLESKQDAKLLRNFSFDFMWGLSASRANDISTFAGIVMDDIQIDAIRSAIIDARNVRGTPNADVLPKANLNLIDHDPVGEAQEDDTYASATDAIRRCNALGTEDADILCCAPENALDVPRIKLERTREEFFLDAIRAVLNMILMHAEAPDGNLLVCGSRLALFHDRIAMKERFLDMCERSLRHDEKQCVICLHEHSNCMLSCGHMFCKECILKHLSSSTACPLCRFFPVSKADCVQIVPGLKNPKMWTTIRAVTNFKGRTILFAQWRDMIRMFRYALRACGTDVYVLEGSSIQRAAMLHQFASISQGAMLICAEESFLGLRIPYAGQILFAHAFLGDNIEEWERRAISCVANDDEKRIIIQSMVLARSQEELLWRSTHCMEDGSAQQ